MNLIPDSPESGFPHFVFGTLGFSRIIERPMQSLHIAGEDRASFSGAIADRHHNVQWLTNKLVHGLGPMVRDVNSDLLHDGNRFRPNVAWFRASGSHFKPITGFMP